MDIVSELRAAGFQRVIVLNGRECGCEEEDTSVILALWPYEAEKEPNTSEAWIHPYYYASQTAYRAAVELAEKHAAEGVVWREDIRLKPIFARLPGFSQGRNTLSYTEEFGSRFHVQILTLSPSIQPTMHLEEVTHDLHCGDCRRCIDACPTNALEGGVFHRERCLRNWQVGGQVYPDFIREQLGNRLIGCDECQRCCPHNRMPCGNEAVMPVSLEEILNHPKETAIELRKYIGATITMFNRLLGGACIVAGCTGRADLIPRLQELAMSPSHAVSEHVRWALMKLGCPFVEPDPEEIL